MIVLVHGADAFGAVEQYVLQVAQALRDRSLPATLVFPDTASLEPLAALAGGTLAVEPFPVELLHGPAAVTVARLVQRLRRCHPRIVHVADTWPLAQIAGRLAGGRLIVTHHTPELHRSFSLAGRIWSQLGWLARPQVVYTSMTDRNNDGRRFLRRHVVPLGIDLDRFFAVERVPRSGAVVGTVARLAPQKSLDTLLAAVPAILERHPDARVVLVGEGEERGRLEELARALGIDGVVVFAGRTDDVPAALAGFDVFALPSLFEGLCLAVIEAQAAGVPVVATPVGGIPENVANERTGLLVPLRDPPALAAAICRLLDDPALARRLATAARRGVARYSIEHMITGTLELYA
jgi:glycosyltransferase involved in cell wall biosynthesis